jgi:hypothetical protein
MPESESVLPLRLKLHAVFAILTGIFLGYIVNYKLFNYSSWLLSNQLTNWFLTSLAFTTPINAQATSRVPLFSGLILQKNIEGGWVEIIGGQGAITILEPLSTKITSSYGKSLASNLIIFTLFRISIFLL